MLPATPTNKKRKAVSALNKPAAPTRTDAGGDDQGYNDFDATPRAPSTIISNVPSLPSTSVSRSGSASPTKLLSKLSVNPEGVKRRELDLDDPLLPLSARNFVEKIDEISQGSGVVEPNLKTYIRELQAASRHYSAFRTGVWSGDNHDDSAEKEALATTCESLRLDSNGKSVALLRRIIDIVATAKDCAMYDQDESGWNHHVHTPLIDALFTRWGFGGIGFSSWFVGLLLHVNSCSTPINKELQHECQHYPKLPRPAIQRRSSRLRISSRPSAPRALPNRTTKNEEH